MAHFHIKTKKGRPYLYVREIARVDGRPKVVSQIYIGSPERVAALAKGPDAREPKTLKVEEFGALWLAMQVDRGVDLAGLVDGVIRRDEHESGPSVGEYFLYAVLNRMVETVSKNRLASWYARTAVQQIRPVDVSALSSQRYWEKWDRVSFTCHDGRLDMSFQKDAYRVTRKKASFGRNIIITDNTDWTTAEIVQTSLDRWQVEDRFRQGNDPDLVGLRPIRHWTDSKIRCHLFTCVAAMTYLRILELRLGAAGVHRTAADVMDDMRRLHSVLTLTDGRSQPMRRIETPTKTQSEVLSAFGHAVSARGVLQPLKP